MEAASRLDQPVADHPHDQAVHDDGLAIQAEGQ
jgi:hypothetical protein